MTKNFESIVKEIDDMLINRDIDKLIKKHEKKNNKPNQQQELTEKSSDITCQVSIKNNNKNSKEEIFELPTRKVIRTITVSCQ